MLSGNGVISPEQKAVAEAFSRIPDSTRFYLTGGTALAEFYFGHRRSYDLDFFTGDSGLVLPFSRQLESSLSGSGIVVRPIRRLNSFTEFSCACCGTETRLQLAYDSPFRFAPPEETDLGVLVNDYQDLTVDKLMAFFGRCTHRDTVDLFLILQKEKTDDLFAMAKKKDPGFDLYWLAVALRQVETFPDRIEEWDVNMVTPVSVPQLKETFRQLTDTVLDSILKEEQ